MASASPKDSPAATQTWAWWTRCRRSRWLSNYLGEAVYDIHDRVASLPVPLVGTAYLAVAMTILKVRVQQVVMPSGMESATLLHRDWQACGGE